MFCRTVTCEECKCEIKKKNAKVVLVRKYGFYPDELGGVYRWGECNKYYCQRCKPPYDRISDSHYEVLVPEHYKEVNEDGSDIKKAKNQHEPNYRLKKENKEGKRHQ